MLQIDLWKRITIVLTVAMGLLLAFPNLAYERVERSNDAETILAAADLTGAMPVDPASGAPFSRPSLESEAGQWPSFLPDGLVNLGLDLRGGAQLLAEVQLEDVYASRMDSYWPLVRDTLAEEGATVGSVIRAESPDDELHVEIGNPEAMARAVELIRGLARPVASLTNVGSMDIEVSGEGRILTVRLSQAERLATDERTMQLSLEIVRRRIDEAGTREPSIQRQGEDRILIQVPGVGSAEEVKELIGTTAQLTFRPVVRVTTDADASPGPGNEILPSVDEPGTFYIVEQSPVVSGEELVDAQPDFDQNNRPAVGFRFNPTGARAFGDYTAQNIGQPFAIVLDDEVISAPRIQAHISGGSGIITGRFTPEESTQLAILLRAGALPAELEFLEERTVGPELGQDSIDAGKIAALVGLAGVAVFMVLSYGWFGVMANVALAINIGLIFGLLSLIGATLTLPGIAGIVLTIGMAVDANVLVFERIREELRTAKGPARAIELGYEKALSAILDSNVTTFITATILYMVGSGPVRGFAITLGLGILTSVFTAIFVTRLFIVLWFERRRPKTIEV